MTTQCIIYPNGDGIAVIIPNTASGLTIAQIAAKDVPKGRPYKIIAAADIPTDRSLRDAWTADFSIPDGHGIGPEAWHAEQQEGAQE